MLHDSGLRALQDTRVGDALALGGADGQQFAGILVDMFAANDIIPELAMARVDVCMFYRPEHASHPASIHCLKPDA